MLVTRKSGYSGKVRTLDLPVTDEQMLAYLHGNMPIQFVFPNLSPSEREFIMTGITDDEWNEMFPPDMEDDD